MYKTDLPGKLLAKLMVDTLKTLPLKHASTGEIFFFSRGKVCSMWFQLLCPKDMKTVLKKALSSTCFPKNLLSAHDHIRIKIMKSNFTLGYTKIYLTQSTTGSTNSKTLIRRHEDQGK